MPSSVGTCASPADPGRRASAASTATTRGATRVAPPSTNIGSMRRAIVFALLCVLGVAVLAACSGLPAGSPEAGGPARVFESAQSTTVRYCNGQEARITEPTGAHNAAPAAVYVHGGSWVSGDDNTGGF